MTEPAFVFTVPGHETLGAELAKALDAAEGALTVRQFPDGETYVRGETPCEGRDVVLAASLVRPNSQVLPLMFCAQALRVLGARRVFLVSPYLPYMRQDARFRPGEVVTSRIFARLLSDTVDGLVTVDPHLHRYSTLGEIYSVPTRVEHAAPAIAEWIRDNVGRPIVVGPDIESEQWVREVADLADSPLLVLSKKRHGDRDVEIEVPPLDLSRGHTPVLVDDIISTARTMVETVRHLIDAGYAAPVCIGVHALFVADAYEALKRAGVADIVTCNTVRHLTNGIDLVPTLAAGVRALVESNRAAPGCLEKVS